ncbi:MAG: DUF2177 family protein [Saprospiraceae bacterium]|nr:DUF2177 family protein [Saprospiraceae bacterium]
MSTNKILIAALAGGVVYFLLGFLFYGLLLMDFMKSNAGDMAALMKEPPTWWALILGNLSWGLMIAVIFGRWAGIKTFMTGLKAGAVIGILAVLAFDLSMFGTMNGMNLTGVVVDVFVGTVMTAVTGGVVGWMLGRGEKA